MSQKPETIYYRIKFLIFYSCFIIFIFSSCKQKTLYDLSKISSDTAINIDNHYRGIRTKDNLVFYVEKDNRTLTAYKNNKILWYTDVVAICDTPLIGRPELRYIKIEKNYIMATIGKHSFVEVDISNGEAKFVGSD